jgi:hypothetical protein
MFGIPTYGFPQGEEQGACHAEHYFLGNTNKHLFLAPEN